MPDDYQQLSGHQVLAGDDEDDEEIYTEADLEEFKENVFRSQVP